MRDLSLLSAEPARAELERICQRRDLDPAVLRSLVGAVHDQVGRLRRRGLHDQFDTLLSGPEETTNRAT